MIDVELGLKMVRVTAPTRTRRNKAVILRISFNKIFLFSLVCEVVLTGRRQNTDYFIKLGKI